MKSQLFSLMYSKGHKLKFFMALHAQIKNITSALEAYCGGAAASSRPGLSLGWGTLCCVLGQDTTLTVPLHPGV